jgi:hypothetical protein
MALANENIGHVAVMTINTRRKSSAKELGHSRCMKRSLKNRETRKRIGVVAFN